MTTEHIIQAGLKYIHKNDHRDGNYNKSQWTISQIAERNAFSLSHTSNWYFDNIGWGLHFVNMTTKYLGVSVGRLRRLFIGKFIGAARSNTWHGYPADYMLHNHDKPDRRILADWGNSGFISFAKVRKILKCQPCNL